MARISCTPGRFIYQCTTSAQPMRWSTGQGFQSIILLETPWHYILFNHFDRSRRSRCWCLYKFLSMSPFLDLLCNHSFLYSVAKPCHTLCQNHSKLINPWDIVSCTIQHYPKIYSHWKCQVTVEAVSVSSRKQGEVQSTGPKLEASVVKTKTTRNRWGLSVLPGHWSWAKHLDSHKSREGNAGIHCIHQEPWNTKHASGFVSSFFAAVPQVSLGKILL